MNITDYVSERLNGASQEELRAIVASDLSLVDDDPLAEAISDELVTESQERLSAIQSNCSMKNQLVLEHALRRQIEIYQVPDELPLDIRRQMADSIVARVIAESAGVLGLPAHVPGQAPAAEVNSDALTLLRKLKQWIENHCEVLSSQGYSDGIRLLNEVNAVLDARPGVNQ